MIAYFSTKILSFLSKNLYIDDDMFEVYKYGIEITISSLLNIFLILIFGLLVGDIVSAIIFLLCIIPLRSYCGGYHASTYLRCNLIFLLCFLSCHLMSELINSASQEHIKFINEMILLLSFIPTYIFAPVKNIHKILDRKQAVKCRYISFAIQFIYSVAAVILVMLDISYGSTISVTLSAVAVMILIEIFMQRRGYHETG